MAVATTSPRGVGGPKLLPLLPVEVVLLLSEAERNAGVGGPVRVPPALPARTGVGGPVSAAASARRAPGDELGDTDGEVLGLVLGEALVDTSPPASAPAAASAPASPPASPPAASA